MDMFHDFMSAIILPSGPTSGWRTERSNSAGDKLHLALDANPNSIAVIMKHLAGNLTFAGPAS